MLTHNDAKTMARSLRDALVNRSVLLSHSDCLEIVARQFGLSDWNTLSAKLSIEKDTHTRPRGPDAVLSATSPTGTSSSLSENASASCELAMPTKSDEIAQSTQTAAPWSNCSFCGKSPPEVRILMGGCGGWEGFRARRNPASGERSNVFICNECVALTARIATGNVALAKDAHAT